MLIKRTLLLASCVSLGAAACAAEGDVESTTQAGSFAPGYIVVLAPGASAHGIANDAKASHGVAVGHVYSHALNGFSFRGSDAAAAALASNPNVLYVELDQQATAIGKPPWAGGGGDGGGETRPPQETPWGVARVGGPGDGTGLTAWVIDSGIDSDHPDLDIDAGRSVDFTGARGKKNSMPWDDGNGHGTHVAGTIAALNDGYDVVGVAAGATVVAVRVLDNRGSGSYSGVIAGVDYVAANGSAGDVANMSLGGGKSQALDDAVLNAADASGVRFALAAGNESDDVDNHSPARADGPNVYTVSAIDSNDNFATFSNYGDGIDWAAPGVDIKSTWKDGGLTTISGTSMATPHVAGLLLLGPVSSDGTANGDPDGNPDPIAHR